MAEDQGKQPEVEKETREPWTLRKYSGRTVWDWLQLFGVLAIPVVLAVGGCMFNAQQAARQQQLQEQNAQDEALQAYLDQMNPLILDQNLLTSEEDSPVRKLARARTLVVLDSLDSSERVRRVLLFLHDAQLIQAKPPNDPIIKLSYASLPNAEMPHTRLLEGANLTKANLAGGQFPESDLKGTILSGAKLDDADLSGANLRDAKLCSTSLNNKSDLSNAVLRGADFSDCQGLWKKSARMCEAKLNSADLSRANLKNAKVSKAQLQAAKTLEGATMPDGLKYEEWKSTGSKEDWENSCE